jgi:hypothetical protein
MVRGEAEKDSDNRRKADIESERSKRSKLQPRALRADHNPQYIDDARRKLRLRAPNGIRVAK